MGHQFWSAIHDAPSVLLRNVSLLVSTTLLQILIIAFDTGTLWFVPAALGTRAPFGICFAAFTLASIIADVAPIPLGLGSFEAPLVSLLTLTSQRYCFPLPAGYDDKKAAPLLCAGLIGYRALRMAEEAETLGIYGFGAAAHIIAQVARHKGQRIFAFTREGDRQAQDFARELGAEWAGSSEAAPPAPLDAAIIFSAPTSPPRASPWLRPRTRP
jgi:hypothetical protein